MVAAGGVQVTVTSVAVMVVTDRLDTASDPGNILNTGYRHNTHGRFGH